MKNPLIPLLVLAALVLAPACSKELSDVEGRGEGVGRGEVKIAFDLPGDDFASTEELEKRDAIAAAIDESGHGEVRSAGSGMGSMEVVIRLKSEDDINALKVILTRIYPEAHYRIEQGPFP
jgi:hypothetical protein